MIQKILQSQVARYILTGGTSFIIELLVLLLLNSIGFHRGIAVAISFWIGFTIALLLQKVFAFKDYRKNPRVLIKQSLSFAALVCFNYLFTIVVVSLFPQEYIIVSRTLAIIAVSCWNYFLYKNFIFKSPKSSISSRSRNPKTLKKMVLDLKNTLLTHKLILAFYVGCSLIVITFFSQYITTGDKTLMGDFDYYSQLYEAFRISVLDYGQFPAWNAWLSGGTPLWQNPQFGLVSLQSLLVLPFGSIVGMKIAYIIYALAGFWGMYSLARISFNASRVRSALLGFIWVFSGFFAGHGITHFTFTSFFLLPWVIYFIIERERRRHMWLGLGVVMAIIALSSVHYATMFTPLVAIAFVVLSIIKLEKKRKGIFLLGLQFKLQDVYFFLKASAVFIVLAGWQFIATYSFVSNNERLIVNGGEEYLSPVGIFKALFMPVDASIVAMPKITWGWGEYSMYMGLGILLILGIIVFQVIRSRIKKLDLPISQGKWTIVALIIGTTGILLALGDFGSLSPFHILHELPGFTQTRVPSRWMIYTIFAILVLIASWKAQPKVINILLTLCVIELFITFGPLGVYSKGWTELPPTKFSAEFTQHDNNLMHTQRPEDPLSYYWYTTRMNRGQIYADDSIINTLSFTPPLETSRCAQNTTPSCKFIHSDNAILESWSPNKIVIKRVASGNISINLNVDAGWRINGEYIYAQNKKLNPKYEFILYGNETTYTLEYAPKFSPSWITWRLSRIF
ncbi:MAG: GtrA family protein [Candidatus Saccharimonas sp.]